MGAVLPLAPPSAAHAHARPRPVVAIVDVPGVVRQATAAKSVRQQIDGIRQTYESEVAQIEQQLREADQELSRQRSLLSPEAFAEQRRAFERRFAEAQRSVQTRQRQLEQSYGNALRQIEGKLIDIIAAIAKGRAINLVLGKTAIVIADPQYDLSKEVLQRLDVEMPSVSVPPPQ